MALRARWLVGIGCVAAVIAGVLLMTRSDHAGHQETASSAVDVGFARDMSVHHTQAVVMASYTREHASTMEIRALASNIASQQQLEVGQMLGWLEAWGQPRASKLPAMSWMTKGDHHPGSHGTAVMPGMATPAQMDALVNMQGKRLEITFLQLMIRHHQGGLPMARFAAQHADRDYVRSTAGPMVVSQTEEIDLMGHLLSLRGGKQLPAP